jgi:hypothetical protein
MILVVQSSCFPPLSTPAFSRSAGRKKELTAVFGRVFKERSYTPLGSVTEPEGGQGQRPYTDQYCHVFAHCHSACKTSVKTRGQIWLLAPLSAPAGVERGWGRGGDYKSSMNHHIQNTLKNIASYAINTRARG